MSALLLTLKKNIQHSIDDDYEKRKREEFINYFVTKTKFPIASQNSKKRFFSENRVESEMKAGRKPP